MTAVRVADGAVARNVAVEIAAVVRLAEASRWPPPDVTVAAVRPKLADRAKRALRVRIVRRGVIVLRVPTGHRVRIVDRARTADRVKAGRPVIARRARLARRSAIVLRARSARHPMIVGGANHVPRSTIAGLARSLRCSVIAARARTVTAIVADAMRASPKPRRHSLHGIRVPPSRALRSRAESRRASMTAKAVAAGDGVVAAAMAGTVMSAGRRVHERRCLRFPQ